MSFPLDRRFIGDLLLLPLAELTLLTLFTALTLLDLVSCVPLSSGHYSATASLTRRIDHIVLPWLR